MSGPHLRPARTEDCAAIAEIWNPVIRDTLATFNTALKTPEELAANLAGKSALGHGFFVAETGGRLRGFATYGQFRAGPGYARTMEHTVILDTAARGQGLGRALMAAIEDHARRGGTHSMFAGVSAANAEGIAFHARLGYRECARLPEVGYKFGQWLDLVLMQKML